MHIGPILYMGFSVACPICILDMANMHIGQICIWDFLILEEKGQYAYWHGPYADSQHMGIFEAILHTGPQKAILHMGRPFCIWDLYLNGTQHIYLIFLFQLHAGMVKAPLRHQLCRREKIDIGHIGSCASWEPSGRTGARGVSIFYFM